MELLGKGLESFFAPPERAAPRDTERISLQLKSEFLIKWFDAVPGSVLVINKYRQIVYCNKAFNELALKQQLEDVVGLRPGEALDCINATLLDAGCGCSKSCATCGAAQAIVKSLNGDSEVQNCRLTRLVDGTETPLDLQVFTSPIEFQDQQFILLFAMDISHELRLRYLTRIFHHGLINTAGGIATMTELIEAEPNDNALFPLLVDSSRRILRDVMYSRDLENGEQGNLAVLKEAVEPGDYLQQLVDEECRIRNMQPSVVDLDVTCESMTTDKRIMRHVVRNMLVNALEARESSGGQIKLGCHCKDGKTIITMENQGTVPPEIQAQVFKRYASTKSRDRGLGSYVMKLFAEQYLGGKVSFSSENGITIFTVSIP